MAQFEAWKTNSWDHRPEDRQQFRMVTGAGQPWAVIETESSDEGHPMWFTVETTTGAWALLVRIPWIGVHINQVADHVLNLDNLVRPTLVPHDDPVRRWLAADPAAGPVTVEVSTRDQLARFSAAEIWRTDDPTRAAQPRLRHTDQFLLESPTLAALLHMDLHPDLLPYYVLWQDVWQTPGPLGRGTGRTRQLTHAERFVYGPQYARENVMRQAKAAGHTLRNAQLLLGKVAATRDGDDSSEE